MSDNNKKPDKIGGVSGTGKSKAVERTENVDQVEQVKKADSIKGTGAVGRVGGRQATRVMSKSELEEFFKLVDQEAEKLFANSGFSKEHKDVVQQAVKMAVNASTIVEDEEPEDKQ